MTQSTTTNLDPLDGDILEVEFPPTDLWSDEPPLESDFHRDQIDLLIRLLKWWWRDRTDFYATGNLTIFYNERQLKVRDFRGPDFFVVLDTEKKDRKSWVVWGEGGKYPNVIIEILSKSTATVDRGLKKQLYQDTFRTPEYYWLDPDRLELTGFYLQDGAYQPIPPSPEGWLWSRQLELFLGIYNGKLRYFTAHRELIATPEEEADRERQRAERAEQELAQLRAQLRSQAEDDRAVT